MEILSDMKPRMTAPNLANSSYKQSHYKNHLSEQDQELLERFRSHFEERLNEFRLLSKARWVREVSFCILTPQSTPFNAERSLQKLEAAGFFEEKLEIKEIESILRTSHHYVRFHKTKARNLMAFLPKMLHLEELLYRQIEPQQEREELFKLLPGFGLKESSHALRNIGRRGLAILDRHILRTLEAYGVINKLPSSMNASKYVEIEEKFARWADALDEDIDVLDFLFWGKATSQIFK